MNIPAPGLARMDALDDLCSSHVQTRKALVYCPDAFGHHALAKLPNLHERPGRAMWENAIETWRFR
jgi:hypothetical protein